jgi:membrane fusion protein (multidrug efflux system)
LRKLVIQLLVVVVLLVGAAAAWYFLMPQEADMRRTGAPSEGFPPPPVVVAEARLGPVVERVETVGTARAREAVEVVAETAGRVSVIRFEEGGRVAGGDVLVELDGTREQAELLEALAQRSDVRKQLERAR